MNMLFSGNSATGRYKLTYTSVAPAIQSGQPGWNYPQGHSKIPAIKALRAITFLGLKDAKDIIDLVASGYPQILLIELGQTQENQAINEFRACGYLLEVA